MQSSILHARMRLLLPLATLSAIVIAFAGLSYVWSPVPISDAVAGGGDPEATTTPAVAIGSTSATLAGTVDPNGDATTYWFQYGETTSYGKYTAASSAGSGNSTKPVSATITGLTPSTLYHFRVVAIDDEDEWGVGSDRTFTTLPPPPLATTATATAIEQTSATLNASVSPNGSPTSYHFDYGTTTNYDSRVPAADVPVGSDAVPHSVGEVLGGLLAGTTYHYRAVATNASGVSYGADASFVTAGVPVAEPPTTTQPPIQPPSSPPAQATLPPATPPVFGTSATIATVSGTVLVTLPGGTGRLALDAASTVPVGTTIDATRGSLKLTNVRDASGKLQSGTFWGGSFTVRQTRGKHATTVLTLTAPLACARSSRHPSSVTAVKPPMRQLWGKDKNGRFVTRGRTAVATVRGTAWVTRDTCAGTLVKVSSGAVSVRDLVKKRTVIVTAGRSYLARVR